MKLTSLAAGDVPRLPTHMTLPLLFFKECPADGWEDGAMFFITILLACMVPGGQTGHICRLWENEIQFLEGKIIAYIMIPQIGVFESKTRDRQVNGTLQMV